MWCCNHNLFHWYIDGEYALKHRQMTWHLYRHVDTSNNLRKWKWLNVTTCVSTVSASDTSSIWSVDVRKWISVTLNSLQFACSFQKIYLLLNFQARPLLKERNYPDLIDERMMDTYDCHQLFWMIRLAEKCLTRDPQKRLSMDTVSLYISEFLSKQQITSISLKRKTIYFNFKP